MAIIETQNLSYIYGENTPFRKVALENVSISVKEGEMVGIIGHTGSGKSTLISHFNGLTKPTSGKVIIDGEDIWENKSNLKAVRFKVGLVFQYPEYQLFEETVYKDIAFGPKNMGLSESEIKERVIDACQMTGISKDMLEKSPFDLSGGQKRRVAIAGVMAMQPKVLILDEPASGLDPRGRDAILSQICEYHQNKKNTVLLVSHSMEDVAKFADRILVMNQGEVFCFDEPPKVFEKSQQLEQMGLCVPQITRVFNRLKENGIDVGKEVYTVKYGADKLIEYLRQVSPLS